MSFKNNIILSMTYLVLILLCALAIVCQLLRKYYVEKAIIMWKYCFLYGKIFCFEISFK